MKSVSFEKYHSEETKRKLSKIRIDKKLSVGQNNGMYKRKHTKETREKISRAKTGIKQSKETIEKRIKTRKLNNSFRNMFITTQGYVSLYKPNHESSQKTGYIFEHRYIIDKILNRRLNSKEQIHHKDLNKRNNDINNLVLFENSACHNKFHFYIYQYVLERFGIDIINDYIKWFKNKFKNNKNMFYFKENR